MKNFYILFFGMIFLVSCGQSSNSNDANITYDLVGVEFYNEFIPCVGGEDFNQENVTHCFMFFRNCIQYFDL